MWSIALSATLLFAPTSDAAKDVHKQLLDMLGKHKTVQGKLVLSIGSNTDTYEFKMMKPNLFKMSGQTQSAWCDGEQNFQLYEGMTTPSCKEASQKAIDAPFFRGLEGFTNNHNAAVKLLSLKKEKFEDRDCRALVYEQAPINSDMGSLPKLTVTIYLDAEKPFPVGWTVKGEGTNLKGVYKNVIFDREMKKSEFKGD